MNQTAALYLIAELGPIVVLFVAGRLADFNTAVAYFMLATILACGLSWYRARHIPVIPIMSAIIVLIGGIITLLYDAPDAIILSDTAYYLILSGGLAFTLWMQNKLLLKRLFKPVFAITDTGWRLLTIRWIFILAVAALANELVRYLASPEFWVDYRFYKTFFITAFAAYQLTLSRRYRIEGEANAWGLRSLR